MDDNRLKHHLLIITQFHPWYRVLLEERNITLSGTDTESELALDRLPLLTAPLLNRHYFSQPPRQEAGLSLFRTSGTSSGTRKAIYYSQDDDDRYIKAKKDSFQEWLGEDNSISRALADMGTGHAASTALTIFAELGIQGEAISFTAPIEEHIAKLRSFKPELLYTMPSILEAIADAVPRNEHFGLRKIIVVGELATSEWQANMAARFHLTTHDILDTYGSIEVGAIAAYSHELGAYVLADGIVGESLPAQDISDEFQPLQQNEGVLVLTSYSRTLFPVIRFVTYDVVRDFRTILHDGKQLQVFSCMTKRIGSELKHGEKISLYDIEEVVSRHLEDASLRVMVQDNKLKLYIKSDHLTDERLSIIKLEVEEQIEDIGQMIRNRLLQGIEVIPVGNREELPSGTVKAKKLYQ
ncbi:hypothetical protein I6N90_12640 [Paenibacillus sp. GSMTC-2017]|uniref:hypothetical protein n=1 Tax=Paenibacillus sp. GSMTC-2017 TaxID=2794350 RepID=UPI0018D7C4C2|nr:hypothetical protein [Paenibacillus sp. GSMTC-2017]MBH5318645.1 hypothetical protein [Paenibacillus sp. GSMTC-2017]